MTNRDKLIPTIKPNFFLRVATPCPEDALLTISYLRQLSVFKNTTYTVTSDPDQILHLLYENKCHIVFGILDGVPIGMNCVSEAAAVFSGITILYMEGFYIEEAYRGMGLGHIFMDYLAKRTLSLGHERLQWFLMDSNKSGERFYDSIGGQRVHAMSTYRLGKDALRQLAARFPAPVE